MASAPKNSSRDAAVVQAESALLGALRRAVCFEPSASSGLPDGSQSASLPSSILVGLSGGLDSSLLLRLLCDLRACGDLEVPLRAIHVNHGLQADANQWQSHCESVCAEWEVDLRVCNVDCAVSGASAALEGAELPQASEDAARRARYQAFEDVLGDRECLALGHHQDDQLETLLLRLARGAGADGLAGMPAARVLGVGSLIRPWLGIPRRILEQVAQERRLVFIEDPSNRNTRYDRNLLRAQVLPLVESRWPQYRQSWGKSQMLLRESFTLNEDLADIDLQSCQIEGSGRLRLSELAVLSSPRRRNLLRHWLLRLGCATPSWNLLNRLDVEVCARADQGARWHCGGYSLYRYKGQLVAVLEDRFRPQPLAGACSATASTGVIELPDNGKLVLASDGDTSRMITSLQVRYRQGGEHLSLLGRPSKSLKKLLNEEGVSPWLRDRLPLVFCADELIWVAGLGYCESAAAKAAGRGDCGLARVTFSWEPPALELGL